MEKQKTLSGLRYVILSIVQSEYINGDKMTALPRSHLSIVGGVRGGQMGGLIN